MIISTLLRSVTAAMLAAAVICVGHAAHANLLTNGSLTGFTGNNSVPSGWTITQGSPDTIDATHNVGVTGVAFVSTPSGPSPDGGTWVGFARNGTFIEAFQQTVTGLTVGATYDLSWFAGNFGAVSPACPMYCSSNAIEVLINGTSIGDGGLLASGPDWVSEALSFIASSTTTTVTFRLRDTAAAYLSIDGISLVAAGSTPVPEPFSAALLIAGLGGVGWVRHRRR